MNGIIRYTVSGLCSDDGLDLFKFAVKNCKKIYSKLEIIICYNNPTQKLKNIINSLPADKYNAEECNELEYVAQKEMWKMYPPRISLEHHELVLDNDLIFLNICKEIEEFFQGNHNLLLQGRSRAYGKYDHLVPKPYVFNSGLYGMSPNFDFRKYIQIATRADMQRSWENWCDDQGIVAFALTQKEFKIISNHTIANCFPEENKEIDPNVKGLHLIGTNRNLQPKWKSIVCSNLIKHS